MSIVWTILILGVLIFGHELGHFILARVNDVRVEEFALGMGPKLFGIRPKETQYSLRLFPIGGYVKMVGEDGGEENDPRSFAKKSIPRRISILVAGPLMNFVLALVLFVIAFMGLGVPSDQPVIGNVLEGYPAVTAGLQDNDRILAMNGNEVKTWEEAITYIRENTGEAITMTIQRGEETKSVTVTPVKETGVAYPMLGIEQSIEKANLFSSIKLGLYNTYSFTKQILMAFVYMFTGQMQVELAGPVGMTSIVGDVAKNGLMNLLALAGILSINLGIINLLPLPALDGGRVVFAAIEGIRGKALDPNKEAMVHFIGLMALFALMILVTYQDIAKLVAK